MHETKALPGNRTTIWTAAVLKPAPKDKYGHICYRAICDCGSVYTATASAVLYARNMAVRSAAWFCGSRMIVCVVFGEKQNGCVASCSYDGVNEKAGIPLHACRCLRCGENQTCIHLYGQVAASKSSFCGKCTPNYHFIISGNSACGMLSDGTLFWIDAAMIPKVSCLYWKKDKRGYIVGGVPIDGTKKSIKLHRFILDADENVVVDHINRNPLDCRSANLREVTPHQNSLNKSYNQKSVSGFLGVTKTADSQRFQARIGLNNRMIHLGVTKDPVEAAQLYNTAARFLYGAFAGELNPVPDAPAHIAQKALERCCTVVGEAETIIQQQPDKHIPQEAI